MKITKLGILEYKNGSTSELLAELPWEGEMLSVDGRLRLGHLVSSLVDVKVENKYKISVQDFYESECNVDL